MKLLALVNGPESRPATSPVREAAEAPGPDPARISFHPSGTPLVLSAGSPDFCRARSLWHWGCRGTPATACLWVVRPERFELPAYRFVVCRSIQLS